MKKHKYKFIATFLVLLLAGSLYFFKNSPKSDPLVSNEEVSIEENPQEDFFGMYNMGKVLERSNPDEALEYYFKAHALRPGRAEPLYHIAMIYREQGNYLLGYLVSKYALSLPYPVGESVEWAVYDQTLLIEFANCALLGGQFQEGLDACRRLLGNIYLHEDFKPAVEANARFAETQLRIAEEYAQ